MEQREPSITRNYRLPGGLFRAIRDAAKRERRTINQWVVNALQDAVERLKVRE